MFPFLAKKVGFHGTFFYIQYECFMESSSSHFRIRKYVAIFGHNGSVSQNPLLHLVRVFYGVLFLPPYNTEICLLFLAKKVVYHGIPFHIQYVCFIESSSAFSTCVLSSLLPPSNKETDSIFGQKGSVSRNPLLH